MEMKKLPVCPDCKKDLSDEEMLMYYGSRNKQRLCDNCLDKRIDYYKEKYGFGEDMAWEYVRHELVIESEDIKHKQEVERIRKGRKKRIKEDIEFLKLAREKSDLK